jgi:hypothetical protein
MKIYNNFRKRAQTTYRVAVRVYGYSTRFDDVLSGSAYINAYLQGVIDGLIIAEVFSSVEEASACRRYAKIVEKAYKRNYINKHLPASK